MKRVGLGLLAIVVLLLGVAWFGVSQLAPRDPRGGTTVFEVERGAGLARVAEELEARGLAQALAFEALARFRGVARELRAGEYELSPALSAQEILEKLTRGEVRTHSVVVPEGLRAEEVASRLASAGLVSREAFLEAVADRSLLEKHGLEGESFEGYLFPETYQLARGLSAREIVGAFAEQFKKHWRAIEPAARDRQLGMHEVVTLASIVEKETGAAHERPRIAAVFLNRLARGMRLETDPTVIYGIENFDGNLTRAHLEDATNPYNTYQIQGLPPGPIANPGAEALRAVVEPEQSDYLYFVSRGDGTHIFSRTYREHARAVDRFQRGRR